MDEILGTGFQLAGDMSICLPYSAASKSFHRFRCISMMPGIPSQLQIDFVLFH